MLPIALLFFAAGLLGLAGCAYLTRAFMRAYDQRWSYAVGVRRGRLAVIWQALRTPLAEPALERQRLAPTRLLVSALTQFVLGAAVLALALASGQ